jgi:hypothetical protein
VQSSDRGGDFVATAPDHADREAAPELGVLGPVVGSGGQRLEEQTAVRHSHAALINLEDRLISKERVSRTCGAMSKVMRA